MLKHKCRELVSLRTIIPTVPVTSSAAADKPSQELPVPSQEKSETRPSRTQARRPVLPRLWLHALHAFHALHFGSIPSISAPRPPLPHVSRPHAPPTPVEHALPPALKALVAGPQRPPQAPAAPGSSRPRGPRPRALPPSRLSCRLTGRTQGTARSWSSIRLPSTPSHSPAPMVHALAPPALKATLPLTWGTQVAACLTSSKDPPTEPSSPTSTSSLSSCSSDPAPADLPPQLSLAS